MKSRNGICSVYNTIGQQLEYREFDLFKQLKLAKLLLLRSVQYPRRTQQHHSTPISVIKLRVLLEDVFWPNTTWQYQLIIL